MRVGQRNSAIGGAQQARPHEISLFEDDPIPPEDHKGAPSSHTVAGLYQTHERRLTRFLKARIDSDRVPDFLHHLFVRFLGLAPEKQARIVSAEAYLLRSAHNLVRDAYKIDRRRDRDDHVSDAEVTLVAPCQIAALEARDMLNRIERSIAKLKPITRQIFLAHRLDGYSYAEIAQRTGLSVKTVEKHMSRAIAHIDRTLAQR